MSPIFSEVGTLQTSRVVLSAAAFIKLIPIANNICEIEQLVPIPFSAVALNCCRTFTNSYLIISLLPLPPLHYLKHLISKKDVDIFETISYNFLLAISHTFFNLHTNPGH